MGDYMGEFYGAYLEGCYALNSLQSHLPCAVRD